MNIQHCKAGRFWSRHVLTHAVTKNSTFQVGGIMIGYVLPFYFYFDCFYCEALVLTLMFKIIIEE